MRDARPGLPLASLRRPAPRPTCVRVRLGEHLVATGRVSAEVFAEAVAWQRRQRPAVGELAVSLGYLRAAEVAALVERRRHEGATAVPLGTYAVERGLLSPVELMALLARQRQAQRPIGEFFVERGLLERAELAAIVAELRRRV